MEDENTQGAYRLRISFRPPEIEISGHDKDWVERIAQQYVPTVTEMYNLLETSQEVEKMPSEDNLNQLPLFNDTKTNTDQSEDALVPKEQNGNYELKTDSVLNSSLTMREFYHNLAPKFNNDYTVAIIAWFTKYGSNSEVSFADFETGYKEWQYFGVDMPNSKVLTDRIQNAYKKGYIYRTEFGTYTISRQGEERIDEMKIN